MKFVMPSSRPDKHSYTHDYPIHFEIDEYTRTSDEKASSDWILRALRCTHTFIMTDCFSHIGRLRGDIHNLIKAKITNFKI